MADTLSLYLAQLDPTVGDIAGNLARLKAAHKAAAAAGADLMVAAELAVCGYPPEDLVMRPAFLRVVASAIEALAAESAAGPAILVGAPIAEGERRYNAAVLLENGKVAAIRAKWDLPNYGVFDEKRVFDAGPLPQPIPFRGFKLGVMVCEDMWKPDATRSLSSGGADILIVINGSPFDRHKGDAREATVRARATESGLPIVYVNQVCGQDELVFDGGSFVADASGNIVARAAQFAEELLVVDVPISDTTTAVRTATRLVQPLDELDQILGALALGTRDYVRKNGFTDVVIGLSGGIDSAIVATVAVEALGASRVHGVSMPDRKSTRLNSSHTDISRMPSSA